MNATRWMSIGAIVAWLSLFPSPLTAQIAPPIVTMMHESLREKALQQLADRIDTLLTAAQQKEGIEPAPLADDATFQRRAYLDLIGRIPTVHEVRQFLDDATPQKRSRLIQSLMRKPSFWLHQSNVHRAEWVPQADTNPQLQFQAIQVENWLRDRFRAGDGYDAIVRKMIAPTAVQGNPTNTTEFQGVAAFYQLNENKPENLAATSTRVFLGVKLECAQCHDHPFAPYTRDQFWETAAFFAEVPNNPPGGRSQTISYSDRQRTIRIPNTERTVTAKFLDGAAPEWKITVSPRKTLADWITSPSNPFFAKNVANRLWYQLFGIGLIDPIDEAGDENLASHPELLDALATALVEHHFDLPFMLQAIMRTQAYQRSSQQTHPSQDDPRQFARMPLRGLTAEQLWNSLVVATGYRDPQPSSQRRFLFNNSFPRTEFMNRFTSTERLSARQTSILQALMLMNGNFVTEQTHIDRSELLAAVIDMPFGTTDEKLDILFLSTLSRKPTPLEMQKFRSYIERGGPTGDRKKAYTDVFWALLNSSEFLLNH